MDFKLRNTVATKEVKTKTDQKRIRDEKFAELGHKRRDERAE
jgi:hypothetical protein